MTFRPHGRMLIGQLPVEALAIRPSVGLNSKIELALLAVRVLRRPVSVSSALRKQPPPGSRPQHLIGEA